LRLAQRRFDLFITSDQNMSYQQNLSGRKLAILMLSTNDWDTLKNAASSIAAAVDAMKPAEFVELEL
jgi:hypothetical protein